MADLRIVDAPVLLQESITDDVKMPTGGLGNFSVRLGDILWYVITKEQLANKNYVDLSSKGVKDSLDEHIADKANPHQVTKTQVGLGNVDNTADIDKPVSNATESAIITATTDMATKAYVNQKDNLKADKATTLSGYGITDAYTKDETRSQIEIDDALILKADVAYVDGKDGDLSTLTTTEKTTLVKAINELHDNTSGLVTLYDKNVEGGYGVDGWVDTLIKLSNGRTQRDKNSEQISILDFCKCDGTDESNKALLAIQHANSRKMPLLIPPQCEVLISNTTTLEPMYGLFGGGRIRRAKTGTQTAGRPFVLLNAPRAYIENITLMRHNIAYDALDNMSINTDPTLAAAEYGLVEVTGKANYFRIKNCTFRGGMRGIFVAGGNFGLIHGNDGALCELGFVHVSTAPTAFSRTYTMSAIDGLVISHNTVNNISTADGLAGDGIKMVSKAKNVVILGNNIQNCKADAIDLFAAGDNILVTNNILAYCAIKGVDIKARSDAYPPAVWGRNQQVIVSNNHIYGNSTDGVSVSNYDDNPPLISVIGNNIYQNGYNGINYRGTHGLISNNIVYSNATFGRAYDAGISLDGATKNAVNNILVTNNMSFNNGNQSNSNNCGIMVWTNTTDIIIHNNLLFNYTANDTPNPYQSYGLYVQAGTQNISVKYNKAGGNLNKQIGWATGAGVFGESRTIHIPSFNAGQYAFGRVVASNYAIIDLHLQGAAYAANATNYFEAYIRTTDSVGTLASVGGSAILTSTTALTLFGTNQAIPQNAQAARTLPFLQVNKTGAPTAAVNVTATINVVTY